MHWNYIVSWLLDKNDSIHAGLRRDRIYAHRRPQALSAIGKVGQLYNRLQADLHFVFTLLWSRMGRVLFLYLMVYWKHVRWFRVYVRVYHRLGYEDSLARPLVCDLGLGCKIAYTSFTCICYVTMRLARIGYRAWGTAVLKYWFCVVSTPVLCIDLDLDLHTVACSV